MRKNKFLILLFAAMMILIIPGGCSNPDSSKISLRFDIFGNYTGFKNLPKTYTVEQAEADGCYVIKDLHLIGGAAAWEEFKEKSSSGINSGLRIVTFSNTYIRFTYLFYQDGSYRAFSSEKSIFSRHNDLKDHPFSILLELEDRLSDSAAINGVMVIITDDPALTYHDIFSIIVSSDFGYAGRLSPFNYVFDIYF